MTKHQTEFREILFVLAESSVEFILVGGLAAVAQGGGRIRGWGAHQASTLTRVSGKSSEFIRTDLQVFRHIAQSSRSRWMSDGHPLGGAS